MALKIVTEIENIKRNYDKTITIMGGNPEGGGLIFSQKKVVRMIEFYTNSRYLMSQKDELGREKPFYNIVNAMCDVENAAKDIDTKDIQATSDDGEHYTEAFLLSKDIYEWMKATNFAKTLNDMRDMHTRYGSLLVKKWIEYDEDGKPILKIGMPEWKNTITDQRNIPKRPIIEIHYMTPMEILMKKGVWMDDKIDALIEKYATDKALAGKDIPIYEVRGEFPVSFYKEVMANSDDPITKEDKSDFTYQLYYFAGTVSEKPQTTDDLLSSDLTPLYCENKTERVYKYLARKSRAGRGFGVGVVEEGEEAQVWTNDTVLKQYRAMEYTTKVVGQSASKKLKGRNMLTEVDDGQILEHEDNKPITALSLLPAGGLNQYAGLIDQWFSQFERATSAYAMQRGEVTTKNFRLQSMALQQSGAVFNDLQEDMGIFITEIFTDWIMPFLGKQLNTAHILSHQFSIEELNEIDKNFSTYYANSQAKKLILMGKIVSADQYQQMLQAATQVIGKTKTHRFLQVPKDYYKKFKAKITVNITGEQRNKAVALEALTNIMALYTKNPQIAQDPVLTQIFMKIVELSGAGISPVTLVAAMQQQAQQQADAAAKAGAAGGASGKVAESINFKDLPDAGKVQMAKQAGIDISGAGAGADASASQGQDGQGADSGTPAPKPLSLTARGGQ